MAHFKPSPAFVGSNEPPRRLGVYIHWPYCARICPYCDFNVFKDRKASDEPAALARAIVAELEAQAALTGARELASIFLGGGTPSLMDPTWAAEMIAAARRLWTPAADLEVTLEANPTDAEAARFAAFAAAGVTRLSLGLQSLDDAALSFLRRNHDAAGRSRHNLIYWKGHDYVGVGPGAHGRLTLGGVREAIYAARRPADYIARVAETGLGFATREALDPREVAQERLLSGLRITDGVPLAELAELRIAPGKIADLTALGLLADDPLRLRATPAGRLVLDRLTGELAS